MAKDGTWDRVLAKLAAAADAAGLVGWSLSVDSTIARAHQHATNTTRRTASCAIRAHLRSRGIKAVIPEPHDQKGHRDRRGSRGGRPVTLDAADYRNRNVIERRYCHIKQWRGPAYDKHATVYRAAVVLNAVIAWTRQLSESP